jgi:L-lactate dehydrogenase complex protein LldG
MSRERILRNVRAGLGAAENAKARNDTVTEWLQANARGLVPQRALKPRPELIEQFVGYLEGQSAKVLRIADATELPSVVAGYLRDSNLPQSVRMGADIRFSLLPWRSAPGLAVHHGPAAPGDEVSISRALAGIAETGTLVLASGADNPVTLSFMPENHIVVIAEEAIVGALEDGIALARSALHGEMPRTLNLISGASRTADIGGRIVIGAHGPRRLAVMIVKDGAVA